MLTDIALKKRLLVDERIIRKLSKKLLSSKYLNNSSYTNDFTLLFFSEEGLNIDYEQLDLQFDRNMAILASFERDWSQISALSEQIGTHFILSIRTH